jgi:hypothetical protein
MTSKTASITITAEQTAKAHAFLARQNARLAKPGYRPTTGERLNVASLTFALEKLAIQASGESVTFTDWEAHLVDFAIEAA